MATDDDRPDEETSTFVDAPSIAHVSCHQTVVYRDLVANDRANCDDDRGAAATSNARACVQIAVRLRELRDRHRSHHDASLARTLAKSLGGDVHARQNHVRREGALIVPKCSLDRPRTTRAQNRTAPSTPQRSPHRAHLEPSRTPRRLQTQPISSSHLYQVSMPPRQPQRASRRRNRRTFLSRASVSSSLASFQSIRTSSRASRSPLHRLANLHAHSSVRCRRPCEPQRRSVADVRRQKHPWWLMNPIQIHKPRFTTTT